LQKQSDGLEVLFCHTVPVRGHYPKNVLKKRHTVPNRYVLVITEVRGRRILDGGTCKALRTNVQL